MARRRHEEHDNHEAWAIPYGDLVTLLLAFFVVMYAMSTVNEGKYRVLSDSLTEAFNGAPHSAHAGADAGGTGAADGTAAADAGADAYYRRPCRCAAAGTLMPRRPADTARRSAALAAPRVRRSAHGAELARSPTMSAPRWASLIAAGEVRVRRLQNLGGGGYQHRHPVRERRGTSVGHAAPALQRLAAALRPFPTRSGSRAIPTTGRSIPRSFLPTGSCRRRAPPAWCICSWTAA